MRLLWILGAGSLGLVGCELKAPDLDSDVTGDTGRSLVLTGDSEDSAAYSDTGADTDDTGAGVDTGPVEDAICLVGEMELRFEALVLGATASHELIVSNGCEGNCEVLEITAEISGAGFALEDGPEGVMRVEAGQAGLYAIAYTASDYAAEEGLLTLSTSDDDRPVVTVALYGAADPDQDGDGHEATELGGDDCDDADPDTWPGAAELWDGRDNDCDMAAEAGAASVIAAAVEGPDGASLGYLGNLGAGDIDGDGWPEVVLGADGRSVYVLDADGGTPWVGAVDVAATATYTDSRSDLDLGSVPQTLGDNDGDGVIDLVVAGGTDSGTSQVAAAVLAGPVKGGALSDDDATLLIVGNTEWSGSAEVLSHLDMDGDGIAEIVISDYDEGGDPDYFRGAAWLVDPAAVGGGEVDLGVADWKTWGAAGEQLGGALGGGDLDGDGYDELLIGAQGADYNDPDSGAFYVIAGGSVPSGVGAISDESALLFAGDGEDEYVGRESRPLVADFDGDGDNELAFAGAGRGGESVIYIHAPAPGVSGVYDRNEAVMIIDSDDAPGWFGLGLAAGDMDGDGAADLLIGAPDYDQASAWDGPDARTDEAGALYLFLGASMVMDGRAVSSADADRWLAGESQAELFGQALLLVDLDGDGRDDAAVASPGWDGSSGYGHDGAVSFILGR